jgi:hypothetical protein
MARLNVRLKRLSPTHHEFAYVREDGSGEAAELETKTLLFHDLLHFAVETEAGLGRSFYGKLASGSTFADLRHDAREMQAGEAATTERAVGAMTGAIKSAAPAERVVAVFRELSAALGETPPAWFSDEFVDRVRERMRRLMGEWKATPFGAVMTLTFET